MTEEQKKELEVKLLEENKNLERELSEMKDNTDFGDDIDGYDEEADEAEEFGNALALKDALKKRKTVISKALKKIEEGKYGICEEDGREIEQEVLMADPASELCKNCKKPD